MHPSDATGFGADRQGIPVVTTIHDSERNVCKSHLNTNLHWSPAPHVASGLLLLSVWRAKARPYSSTTVQVATALKRSLRVFAQQAGKLRRSKRICPLWLA